MEKLLLSAGLLTICIALLYLFLEKFYFSKEYTSNILSALFRSFLERNEKIIEFRGIEEKVRSKIREFEVKTIRHKYYVVQMKGQNILSIISIAQFSIADDDSCFVRGVIDPTKLDKYEIEFREKK